MSSFPARALAVAAHMHVTARVLGWVGACAIAFAAGRWSVGQDPRDYVLADVTPAVQAELRAPPEGHGEEKVPSTKRDVRGSIHNMRIGGFRFNVLTTKRGMLRSGDVHKARQFDMIFSGSVRVTTREHDTDVQRVYHGGQLVIIPANVPHIFEALSDTVMAEWWEGDSKFECRYYNPYRRKVDAATEQARRSASALEPALS